MGPDRGATGLQRISGASPAVPSRVFYQLLSCVRSCAKPPSLLCPAFGLLRPPSPSRTSLKNLVVLRNFYTPLICRINLLILFPAAETCTFVLFCKKIYSTQHEVDDTPPSKLNQQLKPGSRAFQLPTHHITPHDFTNTQSFPFSLRTHNSR